MAKVNLRINNPYITSEIVVYPDNTLSLERKQIIYTPSQKDQLHTITNYDTLSDLAYDKYGDSKWWWVIQDVNNLENAFELVVGTNLLIPDIDLIRNQLL